MSSRPAALPSLAASLAAGALFVVAFATSRAESESPVEFRAGVATMDITPQQPVRLAGYASRGAPHESVAQHLFVKALALEDAAGATTLILSADTIGTPRWFNDELAERIEAELGIPRERFLFACSHSHNTPVVDGCLEDMYGLEGEEAEATKAYTRFFLEQSFAAARAAAAELEPVSLRYAKGEAGFAMNRRVFGAETVGMAPNPDGPVDHEVPVLSVERADGSRKALLFGYACHCTTPGATQEVCGDWAGYAQENLERADPGLTALFITGCGADANPHPRGSHLYARQHGLELAGAVTAALREDSVPVRGPVSADFARIDLPYDELPGREHYEALAQHSQPATQRYAERYLGMIDRGEAIPEVYPCPVQILDFGGDLVLVAIGGEVVVDYSLRLKRELKGRRLWVAGYCNDVFAYLPSARILHEGGYEADRSMLYYGLPTRFARSVENLVVEHVIRTVRGE